VIIKKYYNKELVHAILFIILVTVILISSNMFVRYLSQVSAGGNVETRAVVEFIVALLPKYLVSLIPIAVLFSILITYGKNFANNELFVTLSCGMTWMQIIRNTFKPVIVLFVVEAIISIYAMPFVERNYTLIKQTTTKKALTSFITAGEIISFNSSQESIYVNKRKDNELYGVFLYQDKREDGPNIIVITAPTGRIIDDKIKKEQYMVLDNGSYYIYNKKTQEVQKGTFSKLEKFIDTKVDLENRTYLEEVPILNVVDRMLAGSNLAMTEIQWRLTFPIATIIAALLGLSMCRLRPRQNRYAKLIPAIVVFIIYFNLASVSKSMLAKGQIPWWIGIWWTHLLFGYLAIRALRIQNGSRAILKIKKFILL